MKTALVTGASYGIGAEICKSLLQQGWKVYGLSRSKPTFTEATFVWLPCNLQDIHQIESCVSQISEATLDAYVSNAGVIEVEMASAVSEASYINTFSVNLLAPMLLVHALREKIAKATIITISSVSDRIPEADIALYCSSKAANTSYFNALAQELKEARVYAVLPDYVETPMLHSTMDKDKTFDWSITINTSDIATLCLDLIDGNKGLESGSNIIVVTEALKDDLKSVEKLYSYVTDTHELSKLS